jgi:hypothetical protein
MSLNGSVTIPFADSGMRIADHLRDLGAAPERLIRAS